MQAASKSGSVPKRDPTGVCPQPCFNRGLCPALVKWGSVPNGVCPRFSVTRFARIWHDASVTTSMLDPYRVLDLTDERGLLCGRVLADLGADVLQVEPPAGNTARRLGPFFRDD